MENKNNNESNNNKLITNKNIKTLTIKFTTFVYILIFSTLIFFSCFYLIFTINSKTSQKHNNEIETIDYDQANQPNGLQILNPNISKEEILNAKHVLNNKNIKILNLEIDSSGKLSTIKISFYNDSDKKISNKKMYISLYDINKKSIFGSSITMPTITPHSQTDFNIQCTEKLNDYNNFEIKIIK